jgi:hypothetical protein
LWTLRALRQTSCVSHMSREVCDDSTKAKWSIWSYRGYRRLLNEEMMAVCRIYAEVELADLPVGEGKEAKGWLTSTHMDAECARKHIGARIRKKEELRALLYPDMEDSSPRSQRRRARCAAFLESKGASAWSRKQAQGAADRARLQANRTPEAATEFPGSKPGEVSFTRPRDRNEETVTQGTFVGGLTRAALRQVQRHAAIIAWMRCTMSPASRVRLMQDTKRSKKSQVAGEAATRATRLPEGTRSGRQEKSACPRALDRAEVDLVDSTSESDTSDPGGRPQLFRRPMVLGTCSPKMPRVLPRQRAATRGSALRPAVATKPRRKTGEPPLLKKQEHKIRRGGVTITGAILRVARKARDRDEGKVRSEAAVQRADEQPTAEAKESTGRGLLRGPGTNPGSMEMEAGDARTPAPDQPPGGSDGFARELASTMSNIASLVIRASGRSVSNGGWLYFNGTSKEYRPFKTKCRLFQETYHKTTPPKVLVNMFREWSLAGEVARRIEGAEDMPAAWKMLDAVYGSPLALTMDQAPGAGRMPELQEEESGVEPEAGATSEEEPAPLQARGAAAFRIVDIEAARPAAEATIGPQGKHVFINTPHGIRCLRRLWVRGEEPEHTVVSQEAAQRYSLRAESRQQATWITGPTGVTVSLDTDYEMFLLMDDLPGRTKRIFAHGVNSVEKYCGLPTGATDEYEIQLGKDHVELLEQLRRAQPHRTGARLSEHWGETIWRLAAYAESGEFVWINAIRSYQREESEITLATSLRLGCNEPKEGCMFAVHVRAGTCPITEGPIRA